MMQHGQSSIWLLIPVIGSPGKKILVPSSWIRDITLATLIVHLNHTRDAVKHCTELGSNKL